MTVEFDLAGMALQSAAEAIDEGALAGPVRADEPEPVAARKREIEAVERNKTAETLAEPRDLQQRFGHRARLSDR